MDYSGRNTTYVKKVNKELIRQYLKDVSSATNAEIASVTKLSVSTSSNILNELINTKEVMICDEIEEAWYQSHRILVMQKGQITHSFLPDSSSQARIAEVVNG